ncbi:unnamed protein product, partial [Meganyctiphanes norvegica]
MLTSITVLTSKFVLTQALSSNNITGASIQCSSVVTFTRISPDIYHQQFPPDDSHKAYKLDGHSIHHCIDHRMVGGNWVYTRTDHCPQHSSPWSRSSYTGMVDTHM